MICIANSCLWKKEAAVETYLVYKVVILGEWNFIFWVQTIKINLNIKYCHWTRKLSPNEVCNPLAVFSLPVYAAFLEWIGLNAIYTLLYLCMKTVMCWKSVFFHAENTVHLLTYILAASLTDRCQAQKKLVLPLHRWICVFTHGSDPCIGRQWFATTPSPVGFMRNN